MTDYNKIFLHTAPFIYFLDNDTNYAPKVKSIFAEILRKNIPMATSVITCEEYLVFPFRTNNLEKIAVFYEFIRDCHISLYNINQNTAEKAAQIRAEYPHFKGMDSLQLAAACTAGCDIFLTNDKQLRHFHEITCITINDWENDERCENNL